jgi:hypothetical protein
MYDEAAPQAVAGMSDEEISQALDTLQVLWGGEYMFGYDAEHDPERPWWVIKNGNLGTLVKAPTYQELNQLLTDAAEAVQ